MKREIHFGTVTRNTDTELAEGLRGAVFFESPTLTNGAEYSLPAEPCFPFAGKNSGFFYVPGVGDIIEIEINVEDHENPEPRYRCGIYSAEDEIDDLFKKNYPNRMGWVTKKGHFFVMDDTDLEEFVLLGHTFGTQIKMDSTGSWLETIVRDKVSEILKNSEVSIGGQETISVGKSRKLTVSGDTDERVTKGDFVHNVSGDYILRVQGKFKPEYNEQLGTPEQVEETSKGFRKITTGGGYTHNIGGSKSESIVSNHEQTIAGTESKMVAFDTKHTYGTGYKATVGLGNAEWIMTLGNYSVNVLLGNIELNTLAGTAKIGNALGGLEVDITGSPELSNVVGGSIKIDPLGNVLIDGSVAVFLGGASLGDLATGGVLTFANNPIVDTISGSPHLPSIRVIAK